MAHEHASGRGRPRHGAGTPDAPTALAGLRVLELADDTGAYCGKLLADLGADVVKIEPPGGDPGRALPPFWHDRPAPEHGLRFLYMNTGKRGVVLDLDCATDRELLRVLARDADLVVETLPPGRLDALDCGWAALAAVNPGLVLTSITGFGQTGPRKDARSSDLIASALGGAMHVTGYADDPPVVLAGRQAHVTASTYAAVASLMALHHAAATGAGQHVDISVQDTVVSTTHICGVGKWRDDGLVPRRAGPGLFASVPSGAYRCTDGLVYLMVNRPLHWQALARWIHEETGVAEVLDPMFEGPSSNRQPYRELLDVFIGDLARRHTVAEMYHEGQRRHIAFTPVSTAGDVVRDPQLDARGFFATVAHPGRGTLRMPGAPYRHTLTPWRIVRPAPRLGQHDAEILAPLRARGAAEAALPAAAARTATNARGARGGAGTATAHDAPRRSGALAGIRVVEFTAAMAGPWVGRFMAHAGADVVRVESRRRPDVVRLYVPPRAPERGTQPRLSPWFTDWNAGKRFVGLDLTHPDAVALAKRLVATADVVVENQRTGVMDKLGLGYEALRAVRPDVIMLATSGYGDSGPCARYVTWGPNIEALSSLATLSGFPGRECTITQYAYPDVVSALHGLVAVLTALRYRSRSGAGQYINLSQYEATCAVLGPALLERLARGCEPAKDGNGAADAAPHGCYPCAGEDQWCAIAVCDDDDWRRFGTAVGAAWTREPRFATAAARLASAAALDELVGTWTRALPAVAVAARLQAAGVAAGPVQTVEDLMRDPQLIARGMFEELPHLTQGTVVATGIPLGLTRTPGCSGRTGAAVGQDNHEVFAELLGMSVAEIDAAVAAGAIERGEDDTTGDRT